MSPWSCSLFRILPLVFPSSCLVTCSVPYHTRFWYPHQPRPKRSSTHTSRIVAVRRHTNTPPQPTMSEFRQDWALVTIDRRGRRGVGESKRAAVSRAVRSGVAVAQRKCAFRIWMWLAKCARGACLMHDCSQMPAVRTSLPIAPSAWTCVRWRLRTKTSHCMSCPADVGRNVGSCALSLCRKKAGRELGLAIQRARMAKEWKQKDLAQVRYGGCLVHSPLHHCSQALSCSVQPLP